MRIKEINRSSRLTEPILKKMSIDQSNERTNKCIRKIFVFVKVRRIAKISNSIDYSFFIDSYQNDRLSIEIFSCLDTFTHTFTNTTDIDRHSYSTVLTHICRLSIDTYLKCNSIIELMFSTDLKTKEI